MLCTHFLKNDATSQGRDDARNRQFMQNAACSVITPERPGYIKNKSDFSKMLKITQNMRNCHLVLTWRVWTEHFKFRSSGRKGPGHLSPVIFDINNRTLGSGRQRSDSGFGSLCSVFSSMRQSYKSTCYELISIRTLELPLGHRNIQPVFLLLGLWV